MSIFTDARVVWGKPGLPGANAPAGQIGAIESRLTDLEALPVPPDSITDLADVSDTPATEGQIYQMLGGVLTPVAVPTKTVTFAVPLIIDGGGAVIAAGPKGDIEIPFAATITRWRVLADVVGTITVEVWRDSYANYPPTSADLLLTAAIISAGTKAQSAALSTAVAADSVLRFVVTGMPTAITRCTVSLTMTRAV